MISFRTPGMGLQMTFLTSSKFSDNLSEAGIYYIPKTDQDHLALVPSCALDAATHSWNVWPQQDLPMGTLFVPMCLSQCYSKMPRQSNI